MTFADLLVRMLAHITDPAVQNRVHQAFDADGPKIRNHADQAEVERKLAALPQSNMRRLIYRVVKAALIEGGRADREWAFSVGSWLGFGSAWPPGFWPGNSDWDCWASMAAGAASVVQIEGRRAALEALDTVCIGDTVEGVLKKAGGAGGVDVASAIVVTALSRGDPTLATKLHTGAAPN